MNVFQTTIRCLGCSESPIIHHLLLVLCTVARAGQYKKYTPQAIFHTSVASQQCSATQQHHNTRDSSVGGAEDVFSLVYDWVVNTYRKPTIDRCPADPVEPTAYEPTLNMLNEQVHDIRDIMIICHLFCLVATLGVCLPAFIHNDKWYPGQFLASVVWYLGMSVCTLDFINRQISSKFAEVVCLHSCAAYLYIILHTLRDNKSVKAAVSWPPSVYVLCTSICIYCYYWSTRGPIVTDVLLFYSLHVAGVLAASLMRSVFWCLATVFYKCLSPLGLF
jgi:hypothetical protein